MASDILGKLVTVTVDRPLGSRHPRYPNTVYPINYGFVEGVAAKDGEWQDTYILGVAEPVPAFEGRVIAVIHRLNDVEDKWVVAPEGTPLDAEQIRAATWFQEQYFESVIET